MSNNEFVYGPADFLGWALRSGWAPSVLPVGVVFTFQTPVTRTLAEQPDRFVPNTELTVSNGTMFLTGDAGAPVLVSCLNPGAASMVTQLEHLRFLSDRPLSAAMVGTAGAIAGPHVIGSTVVVESALRTDGISDAYLAPAASIDADARLSAEIRDRLGDVPSVRSWTVNLPYRSTRSDLEQARDAGAQVVEMEAASLFAAGAALGVPTTAAVVISDVHRVDEPMSVDWSDTLPPTLTALDAAIDAVRALA